MQSLLPPARLLINQGSAMRVTLGSVLLSIVAAALLSIIWPTVALSTLSLVAYAMFLGVLASYNPIAFILTLPLIGLWLTEIVSVYAIEMGAFMQEVGAHGEVTGASSRLTLMHVLVLASTARVAPISNAQECANGIWLAAKRFKYKRLFLWMTVAASLVYLAILLSVGFKNGFPLLTGTDRLAFRVEIEDPIFTSAINNRPVVIGMIGAMYLMGFRGVSAGLVAAFVGVSVLFSEKFTSLVLMIAAFSTPFLLITVAKKGILNLRVFVLPTLVAALITTPVILAVYSAGGDAGGAVEKTLERFALQGQMWFVVDKDFFALLHLDFSSVAAEAFSWVGVVGQDSESVGTQFGRFYVMQHYVENDLLRYMIQYDQGYVFTLMPAWLAAGGYIWALLMAVFSGLVVGAVVRCAVYALTCADYMGQMIANKALLTIISGIISGYSYQIFGYKIFAYFVIAWLLTRWWQRRNLVH